MIWNGLFMVLSSKMSDIKSTNDNSKILLRLKYEKLHSFKSCKIILNFYWHLWTKNSFVFLNFVTFITVNVVKSHIYDIFYGLSLPYHILTYIVIFFYFLSMDTAIQIVWFSLNVCKQLHIHILIGLRIETA